MKYSLDRRRYIVKLFGVVQGVGYRPYIYNQAIALNIKGRVRNQGSAVVVDIEGYKKDITGFLLQIVKKPPSLAKVEKIEISSNQYIGHSNFQIETSTVENGRLNFIGADVAICPDCLNDIFDPNNIRYKYPFTNCTNCGPRYSIIKQLPYDRKNTTMNSFQMCPNCKMEYNNPDDRRFHAQPNCCPACGPVLSLLYNRGEDTYNKDPIKKVVSLLREGKIIAIKGLGGFHLVCDALNEEAINIVRKRKDRPHKPLAIMVKDIEKAKELCLIGDVEERILLSKRRPIVILEKKEKDILPKQIAFNIKRLGIMLPYTPLHYLLFEEGISCLVMTSGNRSSNPIEYQNREAIKRLGDIADYFLIYDRDINIPLEDSVVKVVNNREIVSRRARGYTPYILSMKAEHEILAVGAEEKSTFCITQNQYGYLSQYLGDLKDYNTYISYEKSIENLIKILESRPQIIARDLHDNYLSSKYAEGKSAKRVLVQHHHAHMVSCMVEHNIFSPVIGVVFDGTGIGTDGNVWGGEFLVGDRVSFIRAAHFKYVFIQGGDQAVSEPWRIAVSYLHSMNYKGEILNGVDSGIVKQALDRHLNCYETSSVGRLFDCVAALLNLRLNITYDAQAAIELENILDASVKDVYPFVIEEKDGVCQIDYKDILINIIEDIEKETAPSFISAKFHNTIGDATVDMVMRLSDRFDIKSIVLSGGVFENNYLLLYIIKKLEAVNLMAYYNQQIPTNDSGISVGQSAIADAVEGSL